MPSLRVFLPKNLRRLDIVLLPLLRSATQKDGQRFSILRASHPIAGAKIQRYLHHSRTHAFNGEGIAVSDPDERDLYPSLRFAQITSRRATAKTVDVSANIKRRWPADILFFHSLAF